jgi:hypothetical protein
MRPSRTVEKVYEAVANDTKVPLEVVRDIGERMLKADGLPPNFASRLRRRAIIRRDCVDDSTGQV